MKAEPVIPVVSKEQPGLSQVSSKPFTGDNLWARIRHIEARVKSLESEASTLRRDLNATRRKVYREDEASPSDKQLVIPDPFSFVR